MGLKGGFPKVGLCRGLGFRNCASILQNQIESHMKNEIETGAMSGLTLRVQIIYLPKTFTLITITQNPSTKSLGTWTLWVIVIGV